MKTRIVIFPLLLICSLTFAQQPVTSDIVPRAQALNVFFDCPQCDMEYFKTRFTSINYMNDSFNADVHILVSSLPTGGGGVEYMIRMLGKGRFEQMSYEYSISLPEYYTYDETRQALLEKIELGLVPYMLMTPYNDRLSVIIDDSPDHTPLVDPWRNWVFDISGSVSFSKQKYYQSYHLTGSLYISKITEDIKIESVNFIGFDEVSYSYGNYNFQENYKISQKDIYSQNLFVRSLGDHWGIGAVASLGRNEYDNLDFQFKPGPAVEYNIFSYEEAAVRECRILYKLMYEYSNYHDTTIYGKLKDDLFMHDLSIIFSYYEPWGSISANAGASAYVEDISQFSVRAVASANYRIFRGLSAGIAGGVGFSQNQRFLRGGVPDPVDVYTGQWQLEEGFSYSFNFGISYRFGSKNNNAVNPRFGF